MKKSFAYTAGSVLVVMGLIGIVSESGPVWSRYLVFGLGVVLLLIAYIKSSAN